MQKNILNKIAHFVYLYDIKDLNVEDTFYSIPNIITRKNYENISLEIFNIYNTNYCNNTNCVYAISEYFSKLDFKILKTKPVINSAHIKQATSVFNFIEKELKIFSKAIMYFDVSGTIDTMKYTNILKNISGKYNNIEIYSFDTNLSEPYQSEIDFIENVQTGRGGTDALEVIQNIFTHLSHSEKYEFFIISDFYQVSRKTPSFMSEI